MCSHRLFAESDILFIQYTHLNNGTLVRMWLIQNSYMYMYVYGSAGIVNYM